MRASSYFQSVLAAAIVAGLSVASEAAIITIQPSSQDAYVRQDRPNQLFGSGTTNRRIIIQSSTPNPRIRRGLVQFDLSIIPQFSNINSATLEIYKPVNATATRTHGVHRVDDAWLQSTVKWSTQPAHQASPSDTEVIAGGTGTAGFKSFTVTSDVQSFVNAPTSNHGWMVRDQAETTGNDDVPYISREEDNIPEQPNRPKIVIDFDAPPCNTNADCVDTNPCSVNERCTSGFCVVDPLNCDDSDACTDDICDPSQGCLHPVGECNDGFDCTVDSCTPQGGCVNTPVDAACTAEGCAVGTCVADPDDEDVDPVTGCIVTSINPDGTPCNPDTNQCTDDECLAGVCTHPNATAGTDCDDGDGCTQDTECNGSGMCAGGIPTVCTPLSQCHDAGVCDTGTGLCSNPPKGSGATCNDNDACTQSDECDGAGTCAGTNAVICTPLSQCHDAGVCDTGTGLCSNPPKGSGATCNDNDACTQTDQCNGTGTCVGGNAVICTPLSQCHDAGVCDTGTGLCSNPPKGSGATCNDNDACTQTDQCNGGGTCVGSNAVICTPLSQCHDAGVCDTGTGLCSNPPKGSGATCNDNDACSQADTCDGAGMCIGGSPVVCTPLDQCHLAGVCDSGSGVCSNPIKSNDTPCDDGNGCTLDDACQAGSCVGDPMTCGDNVVQAGCGEECDVGPGGGGDCTAQCQYICGPAPIPGCRRPVLPAKASILLKDKTPDKKDVLRWKWVKGAETLQATFGNPVTSTEYLICLYDESAAPQPLLRATIPAGGTCAGKPCWKALTTKGYQYKDKVLDPDGILMLKLRAGLAGASKVILKGKGINLSMPTLPLTPTVTLQVRNDNGECWDAEFSTPLQNLGDRFKAKAD